MEACSRQGGILQKRVMIQRGRARLLARPIDQQIKSHYRKVLFGELRMVESCAEIDEKK